ncbi:Uncharacterised protein [Vibrio cholerae]|nr:Uncharacterised protein [Vibrio cholerae]CSI55935.1 Uncharacterised protein [Vibrio cholerae]
MALSATERPASFLWREGLQPIIATSCRATD